MLVNTFTNRPEEEIEPINPNLDIKNESLEQAQILPVDPTLKVNNNILEENKIKIGLNAINNEKEKIDENKILKINPSTDDYIKSKLSLGLVNEILRNPHLNENEKQKYNEMKEEIKNNNFFYIYDDINIHDHVLIERIKNNKESIEKPMIIQNNLDELNYDIDLHKIGSTCKGIKERHAIIHEGKIFSSKKTIDKLKQIKDKKDREKAIKDKTQYLQGAEIIKENKAECKNVKDKGEWRVKNKNYRIRVNFHIKPEDPNSEMSSFFLYFENEQSLKEVFDILCHIRLSFKGKEQIKKHLDYFNSIFECRKKLYTILKILSVKKKIKKRKTFCHQVENIIVNTNKISANLSPQFLNKLEPEFELKPESEINKRTESLLRERSKIESKNLEIIDNKKEESENSLLKMDKQKENEFKNYLIISDNFMPLISGISNNTINNERSLDDLSNKYNSLKDIIPPEIINKDENESLKENICFGINQGINIQKSGDVENFKLDPDYCGEVKYIFFDKDKPQIKFKKDNKDEEENEEIKIDILTEDNIHEISNIIYQNKEQENNEINNIDNYVLEIFGPKKDNNNGIEYKYKNKSYEDPENFAIKSKGINQYNKEEIYGINLKILHSQIEINEPKILSLLDNKGEIVPPDMIQKNQLDKLLFGFTISLGKLKKIKGNYIKPAKFENKIFYTEHNVQYFVPKEYITGEIIIEYFCIPTSSFNDKEIEDKKYGYLSQFLSPIKIGYVKLNFEDLIASYEFEFPLKTNDIDIPNSHLVILGKGESKKISNLSYIEGKDYSIGLNSYLETTLKVDFFKKSNESEDIPPFIKEKYFNLEVDDDYIYFRPNEKINQEDFQNDIKDKITTFEYQKIMNNKKFNFLPYCEKYEDEKKLFESPNLKCLTEEQKKDIIKNYKKGDWIYKASELKVKLLTKNIGAYENSEGKNEKKLTQYIYCNGEEKDFDMEKLTDDEYINERIIPINENVFNIFDSYNFDDINFQNSDDYQWKIEINFKNELQLKSFLKLLILSRKKINEKWNDLNIDKKEYEIEEILDFRQKKKGKNIIEGTEDSNLGLREGNVKCSINIESIDFIEDIITNELNEEKPYLRLKLLREPSKKDNNLCNYLKNCKYKNSLLEKPELQEYLKEKDYVFRKKVRINKEKFKNGQRKILLGKEMISELKVDFDYNFEYKYDYSMIMNFCDKEDKTYYSPLKILPDKESELICVEEETPIYEQRKNNKMVGCVLASIIEKEFEVDPKKKYEEINHGLFEDPYKLIPKIGKKDNEINPQKNYIFGLYEPNIFRRKILRKINDKLGIDINNQPQNMLNSDKDKFEKFLTKKCIKDKPDKLIDIQQDFEKDECKKKFVYKFLKKQRHEKVLEQYRESEWNIYFKKHQFDNGDNFGNIQKENLTKNKKETDKLYNLIFLGIPSKDKREIFYKIFLDINEVVEITKQRLEYVLNQDLLEHFSKDIDKKTNVIFSLIDNDCSSLSLIPDSDLNKINSVKKIVKSFYVWSELRIGLKDDRQNYVYFLGILYITYKLYNYFENENFTFLLLIGLSQKICHFKQENPLYNERVKDINLFGIVTKLIMEKFQKNILEKFISLNFPIEFFISKHLDSLYADYFEDELMMRIFDILIFESGIAGKYIDDLQYLRILCAIPITLFDFNKKEILECEFVSELETIFNNLIFHTFNMNKFKVHLRNNMKEIYLLSGVLEKYIIRDEKRKWDDKRGKLYQLINIHFRPIYLDNMNYLNKIKEKLNRANKSGKKVFDNYITEINKDEELKPIKSINNSDIKIMLHVSKLQQIYNNEIKDIKEFIFEISFDKDEVTFPTKELILNFDVDNNKIVNIQELYYETSFAENHISKDIFFTLKEKQSKNVLATFSYKLSKCELMKITNIILENKEKENKYLLELILYKESSNNFGENKCDLYKNIFNSPAYLHNKDIEEELISTKISGFFFNKKINNLINSNNDKINGCLINSNYDLNKYEYFKFLNNIQKENNRKYITSKLERYIKDPEICGIIKDWMSNSDISLEEIFYSIALVERSSCINENIYFLYLISLTKDRYLNDRKTEKLSTDKLKEMIYSLYKRFMIYFTKSDVDRMIDFLINDERLFNVKYAFLYKKGDEEIINKFIYDKNRYSPRNNNKRDFEIYFDNINKQLNNYLNYLNNYYNITDVPKDILIYILTTILDNSENIMQYIQNKMNKLTLVIVKDNLIYRREFEIIYTLSSISSIREINIDINNNNNINDDNDIKKLLFSKLSNLNINDNYITDKYITFEKFKKIFFKLPYISDLLRVNLTYVSKNENLPIKEFKYFKVMINYENDLGTNESNINNASILSPNSQARNYFNFYFPKNNEINLDNNNIDMNRKIKIDETICNIIKELIEKIKDRNDEKKVEFEKYLKLIDKISCYIGYYDDENIEEDIKFEKIGYFDSLYSIPKLKDKNKIELKIIFNPENFNVSQTINIKLKAKGYCKIFHSNNNDFTWKKIKLVDRKIKKGKVKCFNNYKPKLIQDDNCVLAYNI